MRISEVFTPRRSKVNDLIYVHRVQLEKRLERSISGSKHCFLYGESGNGKSWLYKKLFDELKVNYVVGNCATASMKGSILDEIRSVCLEAGIAKKTGYVEQKSAGVSTVINAGVSHQGSFMLQPSDDLFEAFGALAG